MTAIETTIILCGGPINYSSLPIGTNLSNAMIPVNGKPVIGWILNDLLDKAIRTVIVVLRAEDERLKTFLQRGYRGRMDITLVQIEQGGTIVQSLQAGLGARHPDASGPVRVILGDTLIRDPFIGADDFVYTGIVESSRRWCIAIPSTDDHIADLIDKQADLDVQPLRALAGYYHLMDGDWLITCVAASVAAGERELSRVLLRYHAARPIRLRPVTDWYDFGNIDNLVDARRRLLQPRHFNSLTINPILNTITKVSDNDDILSDELDWYLNLPEALRVLTPRIIQHDRSDGRLRIVQEYYGYPTLAELFVYGDLPADTWVSILRHVMRIHAEFRQHPGDLTRTDLLSIYADKTGRRLDALRDQSRYWADLLARDTIDYNGQTLLNLPRLRPLMSERIVELTANAETCVMHGDYCFSNILFDVNNQIIRLIDPRGSFGRRGVYGDPRYDVAKLRHSVAGLYDYIVADMFEISEAGGCFSGAVYSHTDLVEPVRAAFDAMIVAAGYDLDTIRLIEGLLFISMPPLHRDRFERQLIMYLTGLSRLNAVLQPERDVMERDPS